MNNTKNNVKQAAIYIRVSTNRQEELSPDSQKRLCLEYAKNNGMIVSNEHIYIEGGISGKHADKRPEFQRMVAAAKRKEGAPFDVILLWKFSRFARNQEESIVYKSMLRNKCNVDVVSITEPLVEGPFGGLIERIIEWMDEFYSIRLAGDVTRGMTENALRGNYQCSPPLGYKIPYHKAGLRIVPEQAVIIRKIYDLYANTTLSIFDITKQINALGMKTQNGGLFERRTVEYILENPIYAGYVRWNRVSNATKKVKDKGDWIIKKGDFEAIIDEDTYRRAINRRDTEYVPRNSRPASTTKHWLSGLIKCSACGRSLSFSRTFDKKYGREYHHFQCYGYTKGKCSVSHAISEKRLVPAMLEAMNEVLKTQDVTYTVLTTAASQTDDGNLIKLQLKKLDQKEDRIKAAYINGIDTLEEYRENKDILQKQRSELEKQLSSTTAEKTVEEQKIEVLQKIKKAITIIQDPLADMDLKREAVHGIIRQIIFNKPENRIEIEYYINGNR